MGLGSKLGFSERMGQVTAYQPLQYRVLTEAPEPRHEMGRRELVMAGRLGRPADDGWATATWASQPAASSASDSENN